MAGSTVKGARLARFRARVATRAGLVKYLTGRRVRPGGKWARALAHHARAETANAASGVSRVHKEPQTGVVEYWFRQRVKKQPLSQWLATYEFLLAPTALQEAANDVSIALSKAWVDVMPPGLYCWFVLELTGTGTKAHGSLKHSKKVAYAMEIESTKRREWTTFVSRGLAAEIAEWAANVSAKHASAVVVGYRTHLWYNQLKGTVATP